MRERGIPLTGRGMSGPQWQAQMARMETTNPGVARAWNDALLENARHMEQYEPGYYNRMRRAVAADPTPWRRIGIPGRRRP